MPASRFRYSLDDRQGTPNWRAGFATCVLASGGCCRKKDAEVLDQCVRTSNVGEGSTKHA